MCGAVGSAGESKRVRLAHTSDDFMIFLGGSSSHQQAQFQWPFDLALSCEARRRLHPGGGAGRAVAAGLWRRGWLRQRLLAGWRLEASDCEAGACQRLLGSLAGGPGGMSAQTLEIECPDGVSTASNPAPLRVVVRS